jgi:uncharacterized protein (DUF1015 family)
VLFTESQPAVYVYHQKFDYAGRTHTRRGFMCRVKLQRFGEGNIYPHEETLSGPKQDRLLLTRACKAQLSQIFGLFPDPANEAQEIVEAAARSLPAVEATDHLGVEHRMWTVTNLDVISKLQQAMAAKPVFIADGHHRYETAVEYARRNPGRDDKLMAFFALEAPGLTILANHRLVHDVAGFSLKRLLDDARRWFDVAPLADPLAFKPAPTRIGVVAGPEAARLTLRPGAAATIAWPAGTSPAWRALAVSILHEGLLHPLLAIDHARLEAGTHVDYTADQAEAVRAAREGRCQAAFLIAPTTPAELQAVVRGGELLPQKSTHFYPKLLDGLVFSMV